MSILKLFDSKQEKKGNYETQIIVSLVSFKESTTSTQVDE